MKGVPSLQQIGLMVGALAVVGFVSVYFKELKDLLRVPESK
jgi:hypothetical protein